METTEENKEPEQKAEPPKEETKKEESNGKASGDEAAKKERTAKILAEGKRLYRHFSEVGFTRDSFIELGESVKAGKSFDRLHPVVARHILKIAAKMVDGE